MKNKFLIIFAIIILGLGNTCLAALNQPTNLRTGDVSEISIELLWDWSPGGGTIKQFKILFRKKVAEGKPEEAWRVRYPPKDSNEYELKGITAGNYEWRIKAEAEDPRNDSLFSAEPDPEFIIPEDITPPEEEEEPTGQNGPIVLKNPLTAETFEEAMDRLMNFALLIGFAVGPIMIIYAAFLMLFHGNDPVMVNRAKTIIFWVVIAMAVILFAKGIPSTIRGALQ